MIDIEDYERMPDVMAELRRRFTILLLQELSGRELVHVINSELIELRTRLRREGVDFPVMTAIIIPSAKLLSLARADLDRKAIKQTVLNLFIQYPGLDMKELAEAIHLAFPDYKPEV